MASVGYARVSTEDQSTEGQILDLEKFSCTEIFRENASGADRDRPQLKAVLNGRPRRNEAVTRCSIGPRPSGIMSLLMGSMYSAPTYHTMLIEPPHAFRVLPHTSPLRYPRPSHREMVQSDQGLRFRLTG